MIVLKPDGFDGTTNDSPETVRLWVTDTSGSAGDWISVHTSDTSNPGATEGQSFRIADSNNADAESGTCAVARDAWSAAGYVSCYIRGLVAANVDSGASVAIGDDLVIGTTAGRAVEYADATTYNLRVIGKCESTPSSNLATVRIYKHPMFGGQ